MEETEVGGVGSGVRDRRRVESNVDPGGGGGARYKLMSPAKLPISRAGSITIPPGLSPTSFLESPVLLSNVKAEPSPTTGSFFQPQTLHLPFGSSAYSASTVFSNSLNERESSCFEFRPHSRSNMVPADLNHQRSEQYAQNQGQCQNRSNASSPTVKNETTVSSNELSLSAPGHMVAAGANVPADVVDSDELKQIQASYSDHKGSGPSVPSDDGYNWRKYGQKHVKGSEFPRSYYKCTHPNCEVKKLFERSHDGHITEIIYKGTHDHPKPQPACRYSAGTILSIQEEGSDKVSSLAGPDDKSPSMYGQMPHSMEPNGTPDLSPTANDDSVEVAEVDNDDPFSKRRKMETMVPDVTPVVKPIREPRVVVQTLSEVDILDDGYRWRKYGQKVVRGNPNPRSYYKCTNAGCPVRKHVERASHDPKAVITTYEGKHNHDVPTARASSSHDTAGPPTGNGPSRIVSEENDTISLDLGVGFSSVAENRSNEQQQPQALLHSELAQRQPHASSSRFKIIQSTPVTAYYGNSPYPYPQSIGRILTGP